MPFSAAYRKPRASAVRRTR